MDFEPSGQWEGIGIIKWDQAPGDSMVTRVAMDLVRTDGTIHGTAETEALGPVRSPRLPLIVTGVFTSPTLTLRFETRNRQLRGFVFRGKAFAQDILKGTLEGSGYKHTEIVLRRIGE